MQSAPIKGMILAAVAGITWGTVGLAQSYVNEGLSVFWISTVRMVCSAILFTALFAIRGQNLRKALQSARVAQPWIIAASCLTLINTTTYVYGVRLTGIAMGAAAAEGSAPIWAGLLTALVLRQWPIKRWWLGAFVASTGVVIMLLMQAKRWYVNATGIVFALIAGLTNAFYTVACERILRNTDPFTCIFCIFTTASIIALCFVGLFVPITIEVTTIDMAALLYLGFMTMGVTMLVYTLSLQFISSKTAVTIALLDPITAFVLAVFVAHEPIQGLAFAGLLLLILGLQWVLRSEIKSP